jgi:hypothetical protein
MSTLGNPRNPVLHIGWWRNGYHEYTRDDEPTATAAEVGQTGPTNREIRKRGALIAALICVAWVLGGGVGWALLLPVNSAFAAVPVLVAIGGLAALPVSPWLGWKYAHDARSGKSFWRMTLWTVALSDLVVVVAFEALAAIAVLVNHDPNWVGDILLAIPVGLVIYSLGLVIFGLPGLLLAIPSCWYWEHAMRRRFAAGTE